LAAETRNPPEGTPAFIWNVNGKEPGSFTAMPLGSEAKVTTAANFSYPDTVRY